MTTVAIEPAVPLRTRMSSHLNNWGNKIVGFAKKTGNWITRAAKWLWNTKAVQWTVSKAKTVASWVSLRTAPVVGVIGRPLIWLGVSTAAIMAMPTTATYLLALGVLSLVGMTFFTYGAYRHLRSITTKEELDEYVDRLTEYQRANGTDLSFEEPVHPGETVQNRLVFLDQQLNLAQQATDSNRYSEAAARMNLINARRGEIAGIAANANASKIHNQFRKECETDYPDFDWNWSLMHRGAQSEDRRLKELEKLQAKGPLTPVK